jgi:endonuclease YncB( thermonuclease family)
MKKTALLISCIAIFWFSDASTQTWTGKVVDVRDGDVLKVSHPEKGVITLLLYGIDAPDERQPFFKQAKEFLTYKVEGQVVNVQEFGTEQKIVTAIIVLDGVNINEQVLQAGYGWVYKKYCDQDFCSGWLTYEKQAKDQKLGLWQDENPTPPWEWRKNVLTKIFRIFLWVLPPWSD